MWPRHHETLVMRVKQRMKCSSPGIYQYERWQRAMTGSGREYLQSLLDPGSNHQSQCHITDPAHPSLDTRDPNDPTKRGIQVGSSWA